MPKYNLPRLPTNTKHTENSVYITSIPSVAISKQSKLLAGIKKICSQCGPIITIEAPTDSSGKFKGIIFITYKYPSSAFLAYYSLSEMSLGGDGNLEVGFLDPKILTKFSKISEIPKLASSSNSSFFYRFNSSQIEEPPKTHQNIIKAFLFEKEDCIKVKALTKENNIITLKELTKISLNYSLCQISQDKSSILVLNSTRTQITLFSLCPASLTLKEDFTIISQEGILGFNSMPLSQNNKQTDLHLPSLQISHLAIYNIHSTKVFSINLSSNQIKLIFEIEHDYMDNNNNFFSFYSPDLSEFTYSDSYKYNPSFFNKKTLKQFYGENCNPINFKFSAFGNVFKYNIKAHLSFNKNGCIIIPNILGSSRLMKITEEQVVELVIKKDCLEPLNISERLNKNKLYPTTYDIYNENKSIGDYKTYIKSILKENKINFEVAKKEVKELKTFNEFFTKNKEENKDNDITEEKEIKVRKEYVKHFLDDKSKFILIVTKTKDESAFFKLFNLKTMRITCHAKLNKINICDAVFTPSFVQVRFITKEQLKKFYSLRNSEKLTETKEIKKIWLNVLLDKIQFINEKSINFGYQFFILGNKPSTFTFNVETIKARVEGEIDENQNVYKNFNILVEAKFQKNSNTVFTVLKNGATNAQIIKIFKLNIKTLELTEKRDFLVNNANNAVISMQPNAGNLAVIVTKNKAFILKCSGKMDKAELENGGGSKSVIWDEEGHFFGLFNVKGKDEKGHEENFGMKIFSTGGNFLYGKSFIKVKRVEEFINVVGKAQIEEKVGEREEEKEGVVVYEQLDEESGEGEVVVVDGCPKLNVEVVELLNY